MPSLKLALVSRRKAASSSPISWLNQWIVGIVASPTPTVPISSDSSSVMSSVRPNWRASAVAVIQPAVPPPRITTERTRCEGASDAVMESISRL
jgi:hypothetical protein